MRARAGGQAGDAVVEPHIASQKRARREAGTIAGFRGRAVGAVPSAEIAGAEGFGEGREDGRRWRRRFDGLGRRDVVGHSRHEGAVAVALGDVGVVLARQPAISLVAGPGDDDAELGIGHSVMVKEGVVTPVPPTAE